MVKRMGSGSFRFEHTPRIISHAAVVGKKEGEGPLRDCFDKVFKDNLAGEDTWEKAESRFVQEAVGLCIDKSGLSSGDIDAIFSGDLLNQCVASTYGLRSYQMPDVGMYGACSTMALTMITASTLLAAGGANRCIAATSSHFSSAERQYRNPLQYGGQRTPTAQWTVTGSGAVMLSTDEADKGTVTVQRATLGIVRDMGIKDANNMGAAMAPAAADTLIRFMQHHSASPEDYDMILTGDLAEVGSKLFVELLEREGIQGVAERHNDCGMMIFDREKQDVHSGGSGCGCSASVLCGHILPRMERGDLRRILFIATGALQNPTVSLQGETVPGVAHAVELCVLIG
ncbi:MAG: stage V sporulation protein AD [Ruminococcaceae bacterium]|nr:stage V sporulation protein AD [Oscillospiraceae bacterium]